MDAVGKGDGLFVQFDLRYALRYGAIGQQHEFFHQLMSFLPFLDHDANGFTFFIQFEPDFRRGEVDSSFFESLFAEALGDVVQRFYFFLVQSGFLFDDLLDLFVGEAVVGMDDGLADPMVFHFSFGVHLENGGEREFVLMGAQGTELVGDPFRQHGVDTVREVYGSGPGIGFFIQGCLGLHVMAYIGDMHADLQVAILESADGNCVIEVFCVYRVDGEGDDAADIFALLYFGGSDQVGQSFGLFCYAFREEEGEAVLQEDLFHGAVVLVAFVEDLYDLSLRFLIFFPFQDTDNYLVVIYGAVEPGQRNINVRHGFIAICDKEGKGLAQFHMSQEFHFFSVYYFHHFSRAAAALAGGITNTDPHGVAMQGGIKIGGPDQDILFPAFYDDKAHS